MLEIRRFFIALGYFTRLPVPAWVGWSSSELNHATRYFPLVGLLVGLLVAGVFYLASLFLPLRVALLLSMIASLLITGAFHEDGLADSADGFGGGWGKDQILTIMKDSRIGTYGAIALVTALLMKFLVLDALGLFTLIALPLAHTLSRTMALLVMAAMKYVRQDDSTRAKPVAEGLSKTDWVLGLCLGLAPFIAVLAFDVLPLRAMLACWLSCIMATLLWAFYIYRRIGGYTGDALGASQQIAEIATYLALCASLIGQG
ncbi:adenosylcobinamide-GDP ribazoletransferase [Uliginosibacterium gangwonense]|uniref:adenosylcobinamide-GDP ribazoletransferase n=1 Tax=Uliginosibacterium gangwonense TaxID=392736 RepID=UPI00037DD6DA|nr:adenosylcobinamide-GDP ribazoletransferase [Uliginosibacterium gangwonense]